MFEKVEKAPDDPILGLGTIYLLWGIARLNVGCGPVVLLGAHLARA